jgi:hypothetical protein
MTKQIMKILSNFLHSSVTSSPLASFIARIHVYSSTHSTLVYKNYTYGLSFVGYLNFLYYLLSWSSSSLLLQNPKIHYRVHKSPLSGSSPERD